MNQNVTGLKDSGGFCLAVFYLVPKKQVAELIPEPLKIIEVVPGVTVGGLYAARYGREKESMSEFCILPAYVRHGEKAGYFMHHYCADKGSGRVHGMREPDESHAVNFSWVITERRLEFTIHSGGAKLISVRLRPLLRNLPFSASIPLLCAKGGNVMFMRNQFASNIGLSTSRVVIPKGSPLKNFPLRVKLLSTYWEASNVLRREPEQVKERVMHRADEAFGSPFGKGVCKEKSPGTNS